MNLPLKIARRYLFAKKSTNAINIISGISVFGISVGTAALILVLSVFNGFEDLITGLFSNFNPDIKVTITEGKTFDIDTVMIEKIAALPDVSVVSQTIEETAYFIYNKNESPGILKGVDDYYKNVTGIDSTLREGTYRFRDGKREMAVLGVGIRNRLSVNVGDYLSALEVYMPKRKSSGPMSKPLNKKLIYPTGTFVIQQDFDSQYILSSLSFAQNILEQKNKIGALEIQLTEGADPQAVAADIRAITGPKFTVKDRYQQDEAFFKIMNIEKWMSYAILCLTLILVAFNMIGALWMIVLDKKQDISILRSMGATRKVIRQIFLSEGILLGILGMLLGFFFAVAFYIAQKTFGIVPIPAGFVVDAYPISMRLPDFIVVAITVLGITLIASLPAAFRAARVPAIITAD